MDWQPIETAPKNCEVLLWDGTKRFCGKQTLKVMQQFSPVRRTCNWYIWGFRKYPTHWMPLPEPPRSEHGD